MKKRISILLLSAVLVSCAAFWSGIGYNYSGSAAQNLMEELTILHGAPYTDREVDDGVEDMEFSVEPMTCFLTRYGLRRALGLDYRYRCSVTYTVRSAGEVIDARVITYTGIDPTGSEDERAYIDLDSKTIS